MLSIICDQYSLPTNVNNLNRAILNIIRQLNKGNNSNLFGIYHFSDQGSPISRYDFAKLFFALLRKKNISNLIIKKIESNYFYKKNIRPFNTALNAGKIIKTFNVKTVNWKYSLRKFIKQEYK